MKFPWPLRYTIPGILLACGLLLGSSSLLFERAKAVDQIENVVKRHAQFIGNQISAVCGYCLANDDLPGLQRQVSALGADPVLRLALVCDDRLQVIVSSQFEFSHQPIEATPLAYAREYVVQSKTAPTTISSDRRTMLGIFPFSLPPAKGELISAREGYLVVEYDLAYPKQQMFKGVIEHSLLFAGALGLASLLAWLFFHYTLNRRIEKLLTVTNKLAAGETAESVRLRGSDELAKLSESFDRMADRIGDSTGELRSANERMKQEINERKFIEEALRNSERRFRSIWENSLEAMRLTDSKGVVLAVNPAYCNLVERQAHDLLQHPFVLPFAPENETDQLRAYQEQFRVREIDPYQQQKVKLLSGRELELEVSCSFIDMERDRPLLLGIFRDVTEKKKQDEQRLALERKLLDSQKLESLGVLAGGIAHDFNNLLAAILGNTNLAQMQLKANSPISSYLKNVEKTSLRAADLCRQMLAYAGKGRFTLQYLDLNEVVRETLELLEVSITKKAGLRVELRPELSKVYADPAQIRQVVMNLVINASEAIGDKPGLIRIRTGLVKADQHYFDHAYMASELPAGDYVFVDVTDSGCGMSPETQSRIFDPFFTTKFTGRGLGLAAVLGIVRGHNGALKIQSELDRGSTFKFLLPAPQVTVPEAPSNTTTNVVANWRTGGTILVVDDDPCVRAVTTRMVEAAGFEVLQAVDGRHGVEVFTQKQQEIRAVLLDMAMPNLNGREAFEEMRRIRPDVKVLLISGFSEQGTFDGPGPSGFLQKPFKPEDLNGKLQRILTTN
jgi:PAS domain S-box-containing protein